MRSPFSYRRTVTKRRGTGEADAPGGAGKISNRNRAGNRRSLLCEFPQNQTGGEQAGGLPFTGIEQRANKEKSAEMTAAKFRFFPLFSRSKGGGHPQGRTYSPPQQGRRKCLFRR